MEESAVATTLTVKGFFWFIAMSDSTHVDCLKSKATELKVTKERMNHFHAQISQIRSVKEQTKRAAVKIQQHHRSTSCTKPESHPKAMCMGVGAGSPAAAEEERGEGLSQLTAREVRGGGARCQCPPARTAEEECAMYIECEHRI